MASFCNCGSLMINELCTNKHCSFSKGEHAKVQKKSASKTVKTKAAASGVTKANNPRRSSKCITYNLNDIKSEESV